LNELSMLNQTNDLIKRRWRLENKYNIIAFLIARFCFLFFLSCCRSFNRLLFFWCFDIIASLIARFCFLFFLSCCRSFNRLLFSFLMFWYNRAFDRSLHVFFLYSCF
jgi:hypothetical protein